MSSRTGHRVAVGFVAALFTATLYSGAPADDELFTAPDPDDVRTEVLAAIGRLGVEDEAALDRITKLWAEETKRQTARDLFERVVETFAQSHPETGRFVAACRFDQPPREPVAPPRLDKPPATYAANISLYYARYLAQRRMYDEALAVFAEVDPHDTVDPATYLFFRSVCEHQLLKRDEGLATLNRLLKNTVEVPVSYRQVAGLMRYELENLKEKSLDELARMMADVERRLDLGRSGSRVQKKEREIVARLDEMIKKLEQQAGGGGGAGGQGNQNQPSGAAQDSTVKGSAAPGETDVRRLAGKGGWGLLDPRVETRARESIKRNFPPHYNEAIKRYNLKLAR